MADSQAPFSTLQETDGSAAVLDKVRHGDDPTNKNGSLAIGFIDDAGNLTCPQLTAAGALPVDTGGMAGTQKSGHGVVTPGAKGVQAVAVEDATLGLSKTITVKQALGSSTATVLIEFVHDDNGTENVLRSVIVGPGDYSAKHEDFAFTTGAAGTQKYQVKGTILSGPGPISDVHGDYDLIESA